VIEGGAKLYRTYRVSRRAKEPLLEFMLEGLEWSGCRVLKHSSPDEAPFRIVFETKMGERMGVVAYAFFANSRLTKNRPADEHRFQIKYGPDDGALHDVWEDPFQVYTTLFLGINPELGFFVAADPRRHSPTRFFISLEFKEAHAAEVLARGWHSWERVKRDQHRDDYPIEVLVGGTQSSFLRLVRFERAADGLDPGHRQLLAEKMGEEPGPVPWAELEAAEAVPSITVPHRIAEEFDLTQAEILDLIQSAPRLKMAVRGWVAETHLERQLQNVPGVEECVRLEEEGSADIRLSYRGSRPLLIECKNVLRQRLKGGAIRVDFQRTRSSKEDPCTRFYSPTDFDLVAACLHSCTESWEFCYALTRQLDPHKRCAGKLSNLVRIDERWVADAERALRSAAEG
jgi:hypothetical protein